MIDLSLADSDVTEVDTTAGLELTTGIITVYRTGNLEPASCPVTALIPPKYQDEGAPTGVTYSIIESNSMGVYEVYLSDGSVATVSSPKQNTVLAFGDGVAMKTLGLAFEVDSEGHGALNQYGYKDVVVDICGKAFTFRIHKTDA